MTLLKSLNQTQGDGNMVVGDPNKFAIAINLVKEWSTDSFFKLGICSYFLNGELYPKFVVPFTFNSELLMLLNALNSVEQSRDEPALFKCHKNDLSSRLFDTEEYDHLKVSTISLEDYGDFFYIIKNMEQARVVYFKCNRKGECMLIDDTYTNIAYIYNIAQEIRTTALSIGIV